MKKYLVVATLFAVVLSLGACKKNKSGGAIVLEGNKNLIKKDFEVSSYDEIQLLGAYDLVYEQKEGVPTLAIEIDNNLMSNVEVNVSGGKLQVKLKEGDFRASKFVVYAQSADLKSVELRGKGDFDAPGKVKFGEIDIQVLGKGNLKFADLEADKLTYFIKGKGDLTLNGKVKDLDLTVKGKGNVFAEELVADNAKCTLIGVGNINVQAVNNLDVELKGSGNVNYKGIPRKIDQVINGKGKLSQIN